MLSKSSVLSLYHLYLVRSHILKDFTISSTPNMPKHRAHVNHGFFIDESILFPVHPTFHQDIKQLRRTYRCSIPNCTRKWAHICLAFHSGLHINVLGCQWVLFSSSCFLSRNLLRRVFLKKVTNFWHKSSVPWAFSSHSRMMKNNYRHRLSNV